jgi:hypothetical protein
MHIVPTERLPALHVTSDARGLPRDRDHTTELTAIAGRGKGTCRAPALTPTPFRTELDERPAGLGELTFQSRMLRGKGSAIDIAFGFCFARWPDHREFPDLVRSTPALDHDLLAASPIDPLVLHYKPHIGTSPGLRYTRLPAGRPKSSTTRVIFSGDCGKRLHEMFRPFCRAKVEPRANISAGSADIVMRR